MTAQRDPDRLIAAFLDEGPDELRDSSYDSVRLQIESKRQWVVLGSWREQHMTNLAKLALAAAAVVLVAVVGIRFLPGMITGPGGTPSPTPSITARPSAAVLPGGHVNLAAGSYRISDNTITRAPVQVTIPAGWTTDSSILFKGDPDPRSAPVVIATWFIDHVYGDSCQWRDSLVPVSTADELINALKDQKSRDVVQPTTVSLGGTPATLVKLSVSSDFDTATCDGASMRSWPDPDLAESGGWPTAPGEVQDVYVVDAPDGPFVIMTTTQDDATADETAELAAIVNSIEIGAP